MFRDAQITDSGVVVSVSRNFRCYIWVADYKLKLFYAKIKVARICLQVLEDVVSDLVFLTPVRKTAEHDQHLFSPSYESFFFKVQCNN